jgi:molybdopterin molybdotransferase
MPKTPSQQPLIPFEHRPLAECTGRILGQDVDAERENPPCDRVCMESIAVSSRVLAQGRRQFTIEGLQPAGAPPLSLKIAENAIEVTTGLSRRCTVGESYA